MAKKKAVLFGKRRLFSLGKRGGKQMKNIGTKKLGVVGLSALQGRYSVRRAARISEFYRRGPFASEGTVFSDCGYSILVDYGRNLKKKQRKCEKKKTNYVGLLSK